jgi:hypothetical protein
MTIQWKIALNAASHSTRCGARTRHDGHPCKSPAMRNGRCRMHGGKSSGAPLGEKHGRYRTGLYTLETKKRKTYIQGVLKESRNLLKKTYDLLEER